MAFSGKNYGEGVLAEECQEGVDCWDRRSGWGEGVTLMAEITVWRTDFFSPLLLLA